MLAATQTSGAEQLLASNEYYLGAIDVYYPLKITIAKQNNNLQQVSELGQKCIDSSEDSNIAKACAELANIDYKPKNVKDALFGKLKDLKNPFKSLGD